MDHQLIAQAGQIASGIDSSTVIKAAALIGAGLSAIGVGVPGIGIGIAPLPDPVAVPVVSYSESAFPISPDRF